MYLMKYDKLFKCFESMSWWALWLGLKEQNRWVNVYRLNVGERKNLKTPKILTFLSLTS